MKKKTIYILFLTIIILLAGGIGYYYSTHQGTALQLKHAEAVMREHPDSAYRLLTSMRSPSELSAEKHARYALLLTQAQFKTGKHIPGDSLISIAYDYYNNSSDSLHKAWSCFYMGQILRDGGNRQKALQYFQQAATAAEGTHNYNLLTLIYQHWGYLLQSYAPYEEGLKKLIQAKNYALLEKDTTHIIYCCMALNRSYLYLRKYKEDYQQLAKARQMALQKNDSSLLFQIHIESAFAYQEGNKYSQALHMLNTAKQYIQNESDANNYALQKVYFFNSVQQYDSALHYMQLIKDSSTLIAKADNHYQLYKIGKGKHSLKTAIYHLELYTELLDSIYAKKSHDNLIAQQQLYDYHQYESKNLRLQSKQRMQVAILLGLVALLAIGTFLVYFMHNRNKRRIEALIHSKDTLLQESTLKLSQKNNELLQRAQELQTAENRLNLQKQILKEQAQQLEQMQNNTIDPTEKEQHLTILLNEKQYQLDENLKEQQKLKSQILRINEAANKVLRMADNLLHAPTKKLSSMQLNDDERKSLFAAIDLCFNNMVTYLRNTAPTLSSDDLLYCCLLKMEMPQQLICALLFTNPTALKKRKYRIKNEKIEQANGFPSLELFLESLSRKTTFE